MSRPRHLRLVNADYFVDNKIYIITIDLCATQWIEADYLSGSYQVGCLFLFICDLYGIKV